MQVILGKECYYDVGELQPGSTAMSAVTITYCYKCNSAYGSNIEYISDSDLRCNFSTQMRTIQQYINAQMIFYIEVDDHSYNRPKTVTSGDIQDKVSRIPIQSIKTVLCEMHDEYTISGLNQSGLTDPHPNFLREGSCGTMVSYYLLTPFACSIVVLCPKCKRNIVLVSNGTYHPLGTAIYSTEPYNELVFAGCRSCKETDKLSDHDMIAEVGLMFIQNNDSIPRLRQYFSGNLVISRIKSVGAVPLDIQDSKVDMMNSKVDILHRVPLISTMYHHCDIYSLDTSQSVVSRINIPSNFI